MRPITNHGDSPMYVGNRMIMPGDTQLFEDMPEAVPAAEPAIVDPIAALLEHDVSGERKLRPVKEVVETMPSYSDEQLVAIAAREGESASPRKSLLEAIAKEQLARANLKREQAEAAAGAPT